MAIVECSYLRSGECRDSKKCLKTDEEIETTASIVKGGGAVIYPTETVYGIGMTPSPDSFRKISVMKGRDDDMPVSIALGSPGLIEDFAIINENARRIVENFLPGPLTLVVMKRDNLDGFGTGKTIGIRVVDNDFTRRLIEKTGPITSTSANRHQGMEPAGVLDSMCELGDAALSFIECHRGSGKPSTVVDLSGDALNILREGVISKEDILGGEQNG